jgi:hypothetical protein
MSFVFRALAKGREAMLAYLLPKQIAGGERDCSICLLTVKAFSNALQSVEDRSKKDQVVRCM